jgi:hypothetical protein
LICSGDAEKAIAEIRRAQELDPLSLVIHGMEYELVEIVNIS